MHKIDKHLPAPHGIAPVLVRRAPKLVLPFGDRSKSRLRAVLDNGEEAAIFLPRGTVLRGGDLLVSADGTFVAVQAAAESVLQVRADDPHALMRAAYHLGNRHTPVEIGRDYLRLEYDPVLADMLMRLGVQAECAELPFEPEAGAYGGGHKHGHDATFAEDYAAAQAVFHAHHGDSHLHSHSHSHPHPHPHPHPHTHTHTHGHHHEHDHHGHHAGCDHED